MRCDLTNLEIESVCNRIKNGDIILQPDFQRGEVWSLQKKKKLIDSILRGWKIPPIHVVVNFSDIDEVLDGQQRLASIRDFYNDDFPVDGKIAPEDPLIIKYHGLRYSELPIEVQRRFKKYDLIIIRLSEFKAEEPAELFYRLNQPVTLTSAEQRNAFIGITRNQIKGLVDMFIEIGANKNTLGFSNSRLAYDEVVSKFCYIVESETLKKKVTATDISNKYRHDIEFNNLSIDITNKVLIRFMNAVKLISESGKKVKFNKATLFSWFVFVKRNKDIKKDDLSNLIFLFESSRDLLKGKLNNSPEIDSWYEDVRNSFSFIETMLNIFNQRASMASTDALSIIYRDIIIQIFSDIMFNDQSKLLCKVINYNKKQNFTYALEKISTQFDWGGSF